MHDLVNFAYLNDEIDNFDFFLVYRIMVPAVQIITEMLNRGYVNVRMVMYMYFSFYYLTNHQDVNSIITYIKIVTIVIHV